MTGLVLLVAAAVAAVVGAVLFALVAVTVLLALGGAGWYAVGGLRRVMYGAVDRRRDQLALPLELFEPAEA